MKLLHCVKIKHCWLLLILLTSLKSYGQTITLDYSQQPLNEILLDLNDRYKVQISINSRLSANCVITIKQSFASINLALQQLAKKCRLRVTKISDVYVFRKEAQKNESPPDKKVITKKKKIKPVKYLYQGQVVEQKTLEPLPFTVVQLGKKGYVVADENGRFSFKTLYTRQKVQLRHLGYEITDTTLVPGYKLQVSLKTRPEQLEEIVVSSKREICVAHIGEASGYIKFNDIGNSVVPGNSNDMIFNNMRLYPGIMAAGESTSDYVIWGSYSGENHVLYDGITMFNSWGVNEDIGRVNPYMIKNLEVYKGGYNVPYGDRIGGVVMIDTKSGNRDEAETAVSLNNRLANAYISVPVFNKSASLQLAGRKSYYQLLDLSTSPVEGRITLIPTYDYSDFNLKFSSSFSNSDQLELSVIGSEDFYKGQFQDTFGKNPSKDVGTNSQQLGSSLKYAKNWKRGGVTSVAFAQSYYRPKLTTNFTLKDDTTQTESFTWTNTMSEYSGKITHTFAASNQHHFQLSAGVVHNQTDLLSSITERIIDDFSIQQSRLTLYAHDQTQVTDWFSLQLGVKADIPNQNTKAYIQPRVNGRFNLSRNWNINFGWGKYNQFITKLTVIDQSGNLSDFWRLTDGNRIPVLSSVHHVLGVAYLAQAFEVSLEGYYKTAEGYRRIERGMKGLGPRNVRAYSGDTRSMGLDAYIKKRVNKHEFWLAYSLAKTEERFALPFQTGEYKEAPQNQTHEIKASMVFNFNPLHLSVTNVNGSGFPNTILTRYRALTQQYYHRTDIACQYRFQYRNIYFEAGFSVLNIFNQRNVRLSSSLNIPGNDSPVNTIGILRTPTIYLNARF